MPNAMNKLNRPPAPPKGKAAAPRPGGSNQNAFAKRMGY